MKKQVLRVLCEKHGFVDSMISISTGKSPNYQDKGVEITIQPGKTATIGNTAEANCSKCGLTCPLVPVEINASLDRLESKLLDFSTKQWNVFSRIRAQSLKAVRNISEALSNLAEVNIVAPIEITNLYIFWISALALLLTFANKPKKLKNSR